MVRDTQHTKRIISSSPFSLFKWMLCCDSPAGAVYHRFRKTWDKNRRSEGWQAFRWARSKCYPGVHLSPHPNMRVENKTAHVPWLVWLSGLNAGLRTKGSRVQLPGRAHAWVSGHVLSRGCVRGNHTLMFLSHIWYIDVSIPFFLPSPLSRNEQIKSLKK